MKGTHLVMLLILALAAWGSWQTHEKKQAINNYVTANQQLLVSQKAVRDLEQAAIQTEAAAKTLRTQLDTAKKESQIAQAKLDSALKANPEWAGAPVPDSVRRALESPGKGNRPTTTR